MVNCFFFSFFSAKGRKNRLTICCCTANGHGGYGSRRTELWGLTGCRWLYLFHCLEGKN